MGSINGITTDQLIGSAIRMLGDIQVPVKYKASITEPIERTIATLYVSIQSLSEEKPPEKTEEGEVEDAGTDDTGEPEPKPVDS